MPKIEDVDEDEVVAAEERGEKIYGARKRKKKRTGAKKKKSTVMPSCVPLLLLPDISSVRNVPRYDVVAYRDRDRSRRGGSRRNMRSRPNNNRNQPLITDLLKEGQEVLIQIAKEPIGKKGARITSHIALPGRFLVYMPTVNHVGVSRKIASDEERQRLKRIVPASAKTAWADSSFAPPPPTSRKKIFAPTFAS